MKISSTFAGFTTAQLAMSASQKSLDITGQNIANINTEGYTIQRLDIASLNLKVAPGSVNIGFGVDQTGVSQIRDPFLDNEYRNQMSQVGETDAMVAGLERLESIIDEADSDGIRNSIREIIDSLDDLGSQVGQQEFDSMVRSNVQNLMNLFHQSAASMNQVREDMTYSLTDVDVVNVNAILEDIAKLNKEIKSSHILGNPALELQDERNLLIDELSGYIPINVKYEQQKIGETQTIEVLRVCFPGSDGVNYNLVADNAYATVYADDRGDRLKLSLTDARTGEMIDLTSSMLQTGSIKGTLDFLNEEGSFSGSDTKGLGFYSKALDSLVNTFAQTLNELNRPVAMDADGKVLYDETVEPKEVIRLDANPLFVTSDGSAVFTADNIRIATGWLDGEYGITASVAPSADGTIASSANDNIINIIKAIDEPRGFGDYMFTGDFYECYSNIENTLAIQIRSGETNLSNQLSVLDQTASSINSVSSVDLDEEGMNLMQYQQSYSAAARFMTTLNEVLDSLMSAGA